MRKAALSVLAVVVLSLFTAAVLAEDSGKKTGGVQVGEKAPDFSLVDQNGNTVSLKDFAGQVVVLEWTNPDCPFVQRVYQAKTMQALAQKYQGKVKWLAI